MQKNERKEEQNEAAIGIGAMIVFIALILVAAVASAVIIQTGEKLQQNAQEAGEGTKDSMSSKVSIINAVVSNAAGNVVTLTFELAAGSDQVDEADVYWVVTCDGGPDSGTFAADNLDGASTAADISPGEVYTVDITIANCFGSDAQLGIQSGGGGYTYEMLTGWAGTPADGDVLI